MPTTFAPSYTPYVDDDDEDVGFSEGLSRDLQSQPDQQAPPPSAAVPDNSQPLTPVKAPVYTAPDRTNLDFENSQVQKYSVPTDRNNPAVKPTVKQRLIGGFGAGMMAFGHQPGALQAGEAVVNRNYNNAEQQRQGNLAAAQSGARAAQSQITDQNQDFERTLQSTNSQIQAGRYNAYGQDRIAQANQRNAQIAPESLQPDDPQNPFGSWHGKTVAGKDVTLSGPPDSWLKTPVGQQATRAKYIKENHLTGDDAKFYLATGKLAPRFAPRAPREPSAEEIRYADWKRAFQQQYGRAPNADEMARFGKVPEGPGPRNIPPATAARINDSKNKAMQSAQSDFQEATANAKTDADRQQAKANLRETLQTAQNNYEQDIIDAGGQPEHMEVGDDLQFRKSAGGQSAPSAPAQPQPAAAQNSGGLRTVQDSKGNKVQVKVVGGRWVNAKTGKPL